MENHIIIKYLKTLGYEIQKYYHTYDTQQVGSWKTFYFKIGNKKLLIQNDELYLDLDTNSLTYSTLMVKIDMTTEQTIRQAIDQ